MHTLIFLPFSHHHQVFVLTVCRGSRRPLHEQSPRSLPLSLKNELGMTFFMSSLFITIHFLPSAIHCLHVLGLTSPPPAAKPPEPSPLAREARYFSFYSCSTSRTRTFVSMVPTLPSLYITLPRTSSSFVPSYMASMSLIYCS